MGEGHVLSIMSIPDNSHTTTVSHACTHLHTPEPSTAHPLCRTLKGKSSFTVYTRKGVGKKIIPVCVFGQNFYTIVKVMWFECEGSQRTDRNSGPQMTNTASIPITAASLSTSTRDLSIQDMHEFI